MEPFGPFWWPGSGWVSRGSNTWADPAAYDRKAAELAALFMANSEQLAEQAGPELVAAGPTAG